MTTHHKNLNTNFLTPNIVKTIITAIVLGGSSMTAMAKDITSSTAYYNFSVKDKVSGSGSATRTISKSGNSWTYKSNASALGGTAKANQQTTFTLNNSKVVPSSAKTTYKVLGMGNTHQIKFNTSSVVSTYKGTSKTLTMSNQAYDDLSLEVQIRQDLLNNRFTGNYYMVKKNSIEKTTFKKSGNVTITTPAGSFHTVRIDRVHSNSNKQTTFWLAPSLDYLPVKVVQKDNDTHMKLVLTSQK